MTFINDTDLFTLFIKYLNLLIVINCDSYLIKTVAVDM